VTDGRGPADAPADGDAAGDDAPADAGSARKPGDRRSLAAARARLPGLDRPAVRRVERAALPLAAVATAAVLVVMFYYPVGTVLAEAVMEGGRVTLAGLAAILQDPFYFGAASTLFRAPATVPAGFADWVRSGFPPVRLGLFGFTAWQALLSTIASVVLGLPGAYVLSRFEFPGRETLRSLTIVPFVLPGILVAIGFVAMFGERGVLNDALAALGLGPVNLMFTLEIIVLAHAFYNAPLVVRLVNAAWERVDARAVETARSLGAPRWRAFLDVVAPQLLPSLLTAALLTFVFTFMTFPIVLALGGLELATVEVWIYARVRQLDLADAAALAVLESAITLGLTYVYLRFEARQARSARGGRPPARDPLLRGLRTLADPRRLAVLAYGAVVAVVFLGPLASMIVASVTGPNGLTAQYYEFLLQRQTAGAAYETKPLPAIENSLLFGVGTLLVAVPMGVVVSVLTTRGYRGRKLVDAAAMAPLAVSGVLVGLGLLQGLVFGVELWDHRISVGGPAAIVAAHAVAAYPFVTRNVSPMLAGVDRRLVESARALGATRLRAVLDVELPLVAPGVVAGAAFAFAISVGEFDSTVILASGTDSYTMPVAVERFLGNRTLGPATAMGTVLLAVTAASFVVIDRLGGRWME
jgi:thiamine transport system permease protein